MSKDSNHVSRFLSPRNPAYVSAASPRLHHHSRGPAVPSDYTSQHTKSELLKRTSPERSRARSEQRVQQPTPVNVQNENHAQSDVHEGSGREGVGGGLQRELHNVPRGAGVARLHADVGEGVALEHK